MAETLRVRANSLAENLAVLRDLQTRKEVQDQRTREEVEALFRKVNAECTRRSAKDKFEKTQKTAQYGPLPGFPSGKWWGIRMDCSRDCVHEPFNENVHHGPIGAISICTSSLNSYNDVDLGDILTFTGKEYSANDKSKDSLILSQKNRVPIRLIRSYCLSNDYAPKTGCRYDGLYTVVGHWLGRHTNNIKYHKFALVRLLNQDSPVWIEKISRFSNIFSNKKSLSPRLTRSFKKSTPQKSKSSKFIYNKIEEEPNIGTISAIVSRQVFNKTITGSPDSFPKSASSTDSTNFCMNSCTKKPCYTNLSIRTNLYNSSCDSQDTQKTSKFTFKSMSYLKSNQFMRYSRKNLLEAEKASTDTSDTEGTDKTPSISYSSADESPEKKVKRVTWADSCDSPLSAGRSYPSLGNGFQCNGTDVVDGCIGTRTRRGSLSNNLSSFEHSPSPSPTMRTFQHVAQIHAVASPPPKLNNNNSMRDPRREPDQKSSDEESMSIDSLAPDKLVSIIVKEKYHPMAKILIGNMIGLENGESEILGAYNTLISKANKDDSKVPSKESKLINKFYMRNKARKNGVSKKQRREIANLMIDAKFEPVTRSSRSRKLRSPKKRPLSKPKIPQRKLVNGRRLPSRNLNKDLRSAKEMRSTSIEMQPKKVEKRKKEEAHVAVKRPRMVSMGVQCALLVQPSVDRTVQFSDACLGTGLMDTDRYFNDEVKSEPRSVDDAASNYDEAPCRTQASAAERSFVSGSAFAAVNTVDSSIRIARLRAIGFRPIGSTPVEGEDSNQSNQEYDRPEVDEEYNKYASEETNEVAYLDEELHFEDIEDEVTVTNAKKVGEDKKRKRVIRAKDEKLLVFQPMEFLKEKDFDKPWHGWKKVCANGQSYWTGR